MKLFKRFFCVILAFTIALAFSGCGNKKTSLLNGKYVDADGHIIENENVTLDVIAQNEYQKNFNSLKKVSQRQNVISLYLDYHIPAKSEDEIARKEILIKQISALDVSSSDIVDTFKAGASTSDSLLSDASNALALADIYAKIKDDSAFENFIEKLDKSCNVADVVTKFAKACLIAIDLSNNDVTNKQEYCDNVIDALSYITSYVPFFDNYFEQTLDTVKVGVQVVVKKYNRHYGNLPALDAECDNQKGFFSIKQFEFILDSSKWDSGLAPSISDILKNSDQFNTIPAGEPFECLKEYILYRIAVEQQEEDHIIYKFPAEWTGEGYRTYPHKCNFNLHVREMSQDYISGYLSVYKISDGKTKYYHQTDFEGVGTPTEDGIKYLLKFEKPVAFGVASSLSTSCAEMDIYYSHKEDTFTFKYMYHVTMTRLFIAENT